MTGNNQHSARSSEQGVVSIIVTLVMMIVITLIVLGFAQLSRREQAQSLDRHLSEQAFLAAESGVNDARSAIFKALQAGQPVGQKDECATTPAPGATNPYAFNPVIDGPNDVSYTCLLVSTKLKTIEQTIAADGKSVSIPLNPTSGNITKVHINWRLPAPPASLVGCAATVPASGTFPNSGAWPCPYGVLRIDMVPTDTNNLKRSDLLPNQRTAFLYPVTGAGTSVNYGTNSKGIIAGMSCTSTNCSIDINNVGTGSGGSSNKYSMRLSAIYTGGTFTISGYDGGTPVEFKDSQAQVDATGRAGGVLRRIQVRFSVVPGAGNNNGEYAIQSASSICKRFSLISSTNTFTVSGINGQDDNNPMCKGGSFNAPPAADGNAKFDSFKPCDLPGLPACSGPPAGGSYFYELQYTNRSINDPSLVTGCTWNWGDGTIPEDLPASDSRCQNGQLSSNHWYPIINPQPAYPGACDATEYHVVLTMHLSNGLDPFDEEFPWMPWCA